MSRSSSCVLAGVVVLMIKIPVYRGITLPTTQSNVYTHLAIRHALAFHRNETFFVSIELGLCMWLAKDIRAIVLAARTRSHCAGEDKPKLFGCLLLVLLLVDLMFDASSNDFNEWLFSLI